MLKIRWSGDSLIFNMGIPILVRRHLYIETPSRCQCSVLHIQTLCLTWLNKLCVFFMPRSICPTGTSGLTCPRPSDNEIYWTLVLCVEMMKWFDNDMDGQVYVNVCRIIWCQVPDGGCRGHCEPDSKSIWIQWEEGSWYGAESQADRTRSRVWQQMCQRLDPWLDQFSARGALG